MLSADVDKEIRDGSGPWLGLAPWMQNKGSSKYLFGFNILLRPDCIWNISYVLFATNKDVRTNISLKRK